MKDTFIIKNMVCNRCKTVVSSLFEGEGLHVGAIELGRVTVNDAPDIDVVKLEQRLEEQGFELLDDSLEILVEQMKLFFIHNVEQGDTGNLLPKLAESLGKSYSVLSKLFSKSEGITLEKYLIHLKIEKVKELIQLNQMNFSEIAYSLNYSTSSHLAKQFKSVTGMSMSDYKKLQDWDRKALDQIV